MKTIGILGGMGSYATCDLFRRLIDSFTAEKEWERPRIIIDNNCIMPSRVRAILYNEQEEELIFQMSNSINQLVSAGAEIIIIGCMTAHYFRSRLPHQEKILDILNITYNMIGTKYNFNEKIMCLCTEGSVKTQIWGTALSGYRLVYPDNKDMVKLRKFIEVVKQNKITDKIIKEFREYINSLSENYVILGCTELPILYNKDCNMSQKEIIDPIEIAIQYLKKSI